MTLPEYFHKGIRYAEYLGAFEQAVAGRRTSGPIQTDELAHYTEINLKRMKRIHKHGEIGPELRAVLDSLDRRIRMVCLTEFWCGDAAQNLPFIQLLAENSPQLEIRYLFRDENTELMDRYLTQGGRSIPKYILFDAATGHELAHWGPRPAIAQQMLLGLKASSATKEEAMEVLIRWYNQDKTLTLQFEWKNLLAQLSAE